MWSIHCYPTDFVDSINRLHIPRHGKEKKSIVYSEVDEMFHSIIISSIVLKKKPICIK